VSTIVSKYKYIQKIKNSWNLALLNIKWYNILSGHALGGCRGYPLYRGLVEAQTYGFNRISNEQRPESVPNKRIRVKATTQYIIRLLLK
jgi:hypothetical protein